MPYSCPPGLIKPCNPFQPQLIKVIPQLLEQALQHTIPVSEHVLINVLLEWLEVLAKTVMGWHLINQCPENTHVLSMILTGAGTLYAMEGVVCGLLSVVGLVRWYCLTLTWSNFCKSTVRLGSPLWFRQTPILCNPTSLECFLAPLPALSKQRPSPGPA